MNIADLIAIDVHTHAEVSCRHPQDEFGKEFDEAAARYFKIERRPTIDETVAYYRERRIGLVMFTVDAEFEMGRRRISNDEVLEAAAKNADTSGYTDLQKKAAELIGGAQRITQFLDRDTNPNFAGPNGMQAFLLDFLKNPNQDLDAFLAKIQSFWDTL